MGQVLGIVYRCIATHLIKKVGQSRKTALTGAITLIQRFGSALNLNIHFHMLFLDGVYADQSDGSTRFRWVKAPTSAELTQLTRAIAYRIGRFLEWQGLLELTPSVAPGLIGITAGDERIVLTWLHRARRDVLQVHLRDRSEAPLTGVFATLAPHRPNPVGLHRGSVLEVMGWRLRVAPMEYIDGTPVVDIKPVLMHKSSLTKSCMRQRGKMPLPMSRDLAPQSQPLNRISSTSGFWKTISCIGPAEKRQGRQSAD